ncbi:alpha/beta hydrolase [Agromyces sp. ISL-38]|uniref:alpha/beta hydrolase family protein n=1 Tax=Agromyces sp. ISL-38 TaxID=2819107 RepID=UPI001BED3823|nr:alpha/beta hydrolase [Agromyces sp. ISL-38]MBT2497637.1 alpha/beta hydrolase [Agromyces sp. ISL-38]MBT2517272.1 alpha/beta hydrolase [Streptomyces sp. ISL-90]
MHPAITASLAAIRAADRVSPELAAQLAMPLFMKVRPALPVRPSERGVHESAARSLLNIRGRDVVAYEWGHGPETVLLVHGWRGRAAQFAPIVRELRAEGYRLVAFDAPANGESAGRRTDIRDYLAAIEALQSRHGRFRAVIGHSFGGLAALTAVREGTATGGVVAISGMADARFLVDSFAGRLGLSAPTADVLARKFTQRVMPEQQDPYGRFDAVATPLPADVPLLVVHDRGDREVAASEGMRLHAAHGERSRLLVTEGAGHSRILGADATLDAVTAFVSGGIEALDRAGLARAGVAASVA